MLSGVLFDAAGVSRRHVTIGYLKSERSAQSSHLDRPAQSRSLECH